MIIITSYNKKESILIDQLLCDVSDNLDPLVSATNVKRRTINFACLRCSGQNHPYFYGLGFVWRWLCLPAVCKEIDERLDSLRYSTDQIDGTGQMTWPPVSLRVRKMWKKLVGKTHGHPFRGCRCVPVLTQRTTQSVIDENFCLGSWILSSRSASKWRHKSGPRARL